MGVKSTVAKWHEFEKEVSAWLQASGYDVEANAKAAKPRQTDIYARDDEGVEYLVEAKDRKRDIEILDIDELRSRLKRVPSDVVGIIFASGNISESAIEAIEADRSREVIVFAQGEVENLRSGRLNLRVLIERKRKELRVHGRVWFGNSWGDEFVAVSLPHGTIEFQFGQTKTKIFEAPAHFCDALFAQDIPDPSWGMLGNGARLTLDLSLGTTGDLRNLCGYLHKTFGLSERGAFAIEQSDCSWFGVGLEAFLLAVENWDTRYDQATAKQFHSGETFRYFDKFRDGWLELSSQQRIHRGRFKNNFVYNSQLVLHLGGVPVDRARIEHLCQYTRNDWACFDTLSEPPSFRIRFGSPKKLKVMGFAVDHSERFEPTGIVVAIVARNPFYGIRALPKELKEKSIASLSETEVLICDLRDRHSLGDVVDYYQLTGIEVLDGGVGQVIRPFCTWHEILRTS